MWQRFVWLVTNRKTWEQFVWLVTNCFCLWKKSLKSNTCSDYDIFLFLSHEGTQMRVLCWKEVTILAMRYRYREYWQPEWDFVNIKLSSWIGLRTRQSWEYFITEMIYQSIAPFPEFEFRFCGEFAWYVSLCIEGHHPSVVSWAASLAGTSRRPRSDVACSSILSSKAISSSWEAICFTSSSVGRDTAAYHCIRLQTTP